MAALCRVPEEAPQAIATLIADCMSAEPGERPTTKEIITRLQAASGAAPA